MNAIRHADGHEDDRHHGGDEEHRGTEHCHNAECPDDRHHYNCQRQEDATDAAVGTIQSHHNHDQDQGQEGCGVARALFLEGDLNRATPGKLECFRHPRRFFGLEHVVDGSVHRHPPQRAFLRAVCLFHLGYNEQSGPVLGYDPIDEHVVGE